MTLWRCAGCLTCGLPLSSCSGSTKPESTAIPNQCKSTRRSPANCCAVSNPHCNNCLMHDFEDDSLAAGWREMVQRVRARTPARLLVRRAGAGYRTETQIDLREAHAAARDAIGAEMDLRAIFEGGFLEQWKLFEVVTQAGDKRGFLLR